MGKMPNQGGLEREPTTVFLQKEGTIVPAEKELADYLLRSGMISEPALGNGKRAEVAKRAREENYQNVESLLERYRTLKKLLAATRKELNERLEGESAVGSTLSSKESFEQIGHRLELMSVEDERRFRAIYMPQIESARRIEVALSSLELALHLIKSQDEQSYRVIFETYINGEEKPLIRDVLNTLGYSSNSAYYAKLEKARKSLAVQMFGYTDNRAELTSILVYLRQQCDDSYFPEFL